MKEFHALECAEANFYFFHQSYTWAEGYISYGPGDCYVGMIDLPNLDKSITYFESKLFKVNKEIQELKNQLFI